MYNCTLPLVHVCTITNYFIHFLCVHYSDHEKCMEESEAPAKDLKILQRNIKNQYKNYRRS